MEKSAVLATFLGGRVSIVVGDITRQHTDAIVNAANASLLGGGGVDGAIHRAGGPGILEECREVRRTRFPDGLPTGQAVITNAGDLAAQFVIHTVGPIKGRADGHDAELLASCYHNSLSLAVEHNLGTVAFPSIATGAFGYPREEAVAASSEAIRRFLAGDSSLREVRLVFYTREDGKVFQRNQRFEAEG